MSNDNFEVLKYHFGALIYISFEILDKKNTLIVSFANVLG